MATAIRVFCDVGDDVEAIDLEQTTIFGRRQAAVIERLAMEGANGFAVAGPTRKQQCRRRRGVLAENREHPPLMLRSEMKETVPGEETVKSLAEGERSHIRHQPARARKTPLADLNHCRRGIDARQRISSIDEKTRDRLGCSAANIENATTLRQERSKALEPRPFEQLSRPDPIPGLGVPIIEVD